MAIVPNVNLISNIGFGDGATHTKEINEFANIPTESITDIIHPKYLIPSLFADAYHMDKATWSPPPKKKGILSRFWKAVKTNFKILKEYTNVF
jgi:hypothetical protein